VPEQFAERDPARLAALVDAHPLGMWVVLADGALTINHVPFLLDRAAGPHGTLRGHVARANPVWQSLARASASAVVFQGPDAYVTPSWYATKVEHGRVVPTWNYAVVHAHGAARAIEDREWLRELVAALTDRHEAGRAAPWRVTDAPADFVDGLFGAIVGVEITIERLVGKWKVSQNRPAADRAGVAAGLRAAGDPMAALVDDGEE
jgi:transcriptional regulator